MYVTFTITWCCDHTEWKQAISQYRYALSKWRRHHNHLLLPVACAPCRINKPFLSSSAGCPDHLQLGVQTKFWKPFGPRGASGIAGLVGARTAAAASWGAAATWAFWAAATAARVPAGGAHGFPRLIGSGPGSRNFGLPAAVASEVTHPIGFGNCGDDGCLIKTRMMPFGIVSDGETCSTISPSCKVLTSGL